MPMQQDIILNVENLKMYFPIYRGVFKRQVGDVKAVDNVSLYVRHGETLGLVGESGCGKTTSGRAIIRLYKPTAGKVVFKGKPVDSLHGDELRHLHQKMQMIFQDPYASLNPRQSVFRIISEPLAVHQLVPRNKRKERVAELMQLVGLHPSLMTRYPHEFSGGQRQRIGIARALALNPELIICDEPISALDVSIQAQVVNLLEELQEKLQLTYIFIAHDLSMVRHISDRVAIMYLGKIVEMGDREEVFNNPYHPYTQALLSAVPIPDPDVEENRKRILLEGDLPSPANPPKVCNFNTRCPIAEDICFQEDPPYLEITPGHFSACHFAKPENPHSANIMNRQKEKENNVQAGKPVN